MVILMKYTYVMLLIIVLISAYMVAYTVTNYNQLQKPINSDSKDNVSYNITCDYIEDMIMEHKSDFLHKLLSTKEFREFLNKNKMDINSLKDKDLYINSIRKIDKGLFRVDLEIRLSVVDSIYVSIVVDKDLDIVRVIEPITFNVSSSSEANNFIKKGMLFIKSRDKIEKLLNDPRVANVLKNYSIDPNSTLDYILHMYLNKSKGPDTYIEGGKAYYMLAIQYLRVEYNGTSTLIPDYMYSRQNISGTCKETISIHIMFSLDKDINPIVYKVNVMDLPFCMHSHNMIKA